MLRTFHSWYEPVIKIDIGWRRKETSRGTTLSSKPSTANKAASTYSPKL